MERMFENAKDAKNFIFSGNAIVTVVSKKTGQRFTYKVTRPSGDKYDNKPDNGFRFVSVLTGPDNNQSYSFIGTIRENAFTHSRKSKIAVSALSVQGFAWVLRRLNMLILDDSVEIWHEGRCGKCGKRLTVPASIASGLGPECVKTAFKCI